MKLILILLLVALCGCVGYGVSANYKQRHKFFLIFQRFLNSCKTEINFTATKLFNIIEQFKVVNKNKDFTKLLDNYVATIHSGNDLNYGNLFYGINFLNEQEKESIFIFFKELGKTDVYNQTESINNMQKLCNEMVESSKKDCAKYCSLYTKLGVLVGLFVALIII